MESLVDPVCKLRVKIKTLRSEFTEYEFQKIKENETFQKETSTTSTEDVGSSASADSIKESSNGNSKSFEEEESRGAHSDAMELDSEDNNVGGNEEWMIVKKENQENQKEEMEFTEQEYQRDDETSQPEKQEAEMEWVDFFPHFKQNFINFETNYHNLHTGIMNSTISLEACDNFEKSLKTLLDTYYSFSIKQKRWKKLTRFMDVILEDVEKYFHCYEKDPENIGSKVLLELTHIKELEQGIDSYIAEIKEKLLEFDGLFDDWDHAKLGEEKSSGLDPIDKPINCCLDYLFCSIRSILEDIFDIFTERGDINLSTGLDSVIGAVSGILKTLNFIVDGSTRSPFSADEVKLNAEQLVEDINQLEIEIRNSRLFNDNEEESLDQKVTGWKQWTNENIDKVIEACDNALQEEENEESDDSSRESNDYEAGNSYSSSGSSYDNGCEESKNDDDNDCEEVSNKVIVDTVIDNVIEIDDSEDE